MADMQNAYVKLDKVSKIYQMGEVEIKAVDEISFEISKGEFVVIVGWQKYCRLQQPAADCLSSE